MARAKAVSGVVVSFALAILALPVGDGAEAPQPSCMNNQLFLHYNMTRNEGWMDTDPDGAGDTGWHNICGLFMETRRLLSFPLKPSLNNTNTLSMNATHKWSVGICLLGDKPGDVTGGLAIDGVFSCSKNLLADGKGWFCMEYDVGLGFIDHRWNLTFNISFMMHGGDLVAPNFELLTRGHSNLTFPIMATEPDTDNDGLPDLVDPDDDGDGHNDTDDAYPPDPTRWEKPRPAGGFLPGFDALMAIIAIGIIAVMLIRRRRPQWPLRYRP